MEDFDGVKIALLHNNTILMYLRDDKPGLRFANLWDFFGGGREGAEPPYDCINRELTEELGIQLDRDQIIYEKLFPAMHDPKKVAYFMVGTLSEENIQNVTFGSEGQRYDFIAIPDFFKRTDIVEPLKPRLRSYLEMQ